MFGRRLLPSGSARSHRPDPVQLGSVLMPKSRSASGYSAQMGRSVRGPGKKPGFAHFCGSITPGVRWRSTGAVGFTPVDVGVDRVRSDPTDCSPGVCVQAIHPRAISSTEKSASGIPLAPIKPVVYQNVLSLNASAGSLRHSGLTSPVWLCADAAAQQHYSRCPSPTWRRVLEPASLPL